MTVNRADLREYQWAAYEAITSVEESFKSLVMPTGSGKTRIALAYADALLDEGRSVAYACESDAHAKQVCEEANAIGVDVKWIPGAQNPRAPDGLLEERDFLLEDYDAAFHIGVFSWHGYFLGSEVPRAQTVVLDDAHAINGQGLSYSVVEVRRGMFGRQFERLRDLLKTAHPTLSDAIEQISRPVYLGGKAVLAPPPPDEDIAAGVADFVRRLSEGGGYHRYLLRNRLAVCPRFVYWPCVITLDSICWRPFVLPFSSYGQNPSDPNPEGEIVLLTSTRDSEDFLQRRLGLPHAPKEAPIDDHLDDDEELPEMGTRLVVPYRDFSSTNPPSGAQLKIAREWALEFGSVLVSVSSDRACGKVMGGIGDDIASLRYQNPGSLDDFRTLEEPKVLILVNRPSGIDIPEDVCRVGLHLDHPYSMVGHEVVSGEVEKSGTVAEASLGVRLTQLLGRLNRDPDDRSAHLLLAGKLPLSRNSVFTNSLDPEVLLDLLIGRRGLRRQWASPIDDAFMTEIAAFLNGDDSQRDAHLEDQRRARERYLETGYADFHPGLTALTEANLFAARGNYHEAARRFNVLAQDAENQGYPNHAAFYLFQSICYALAPESDAEDIFGKGGVETAVARGLRLNPQSSSLLGGFNELRSDVEVQPEEFQHQAVVLDLKSQSLSFYKRWIDEYEDQIPASEDRQSEDAWTDFWQGRLASRDHESLLDAYCDAFQLLGSSTPNRGVENNDAKIQWDSLDTTRSVALEVKGWDNEQGGESSELTEDDLEQAVDNAQAVNASFILLASSKGGRERLVPRKAENYGIGVLLSEQALALASRLAEQCSALDRALAGAQGVEEVPLEALAFEGLLSDNRGMIPTSAIRDLGLND